jgi:hypothetical protein
MKLIVLAFSLIILIKKPLLCLHFDYRVLNMSKLNGRKQWTGIEPTTLTTKIS